MTQGSGQPPDGTDAGRPHSSRNAAQSLMVACLLGAIILLIALAAFSYR